MMTAGFGQVEAGKLLLEHGANINCLDSVSAIVHTLQHYSIRNLLLLSESRKNTLLWQRHVKMANTSL